MLNYTLNLIIIRSIKVVLILANILIYVAPSTDAQSGATDGNIPSSIQGLDFGSNRQSSNFNCPINNAYQSFGGDFAGLNKLLNMNAPTTSNTNSSNVLDNSNAILEGFFGIFEMINGNSEIGGNSYLSTDNYIETSQLENQSTEESNEVKVLDGPPSTNQEFNNPISDFDNSPSEDLELKTTNEPLEYGDKPSNNSNLNDVIELLDGMNDTPISTKVEDPLASEPEPVRLPDPSDLQNDNGDGNNVFENDASSAGTEEINDLVPEPVMLPDPSELQSDNIELHVEIEKNNSEVAPKSLEFLEYEKEIREQILHNKIVWSENVEDVGYYVDVDGDGNVGGEYDKIYYDQGNGKTVEFMKSPDNIGFDMKVTNENGFPSGSFDRELNSESIFHIEDSPIIPEGVDKNSYIESFIAYNKAKAFAGRIAISQSELNDVVGQSLSNISIDLLTGAAIDKLISPINSTVRTISTAKDLYDVTQAAIDGFDAIAGNISRENLIKYYSSSSGGNLDSFSANLMAIQFQNYVIARRNEAIAARNLANFETVIK